MTLLKLENVQASYGASKALFDINLTIEEGQVSALMGRNGMGKSTTVKAICRMIKSEGDIFFDGANVNKLKSHQIAWQGIGLVPEGRRCFASLSVTENLIAAERKGYWTLKRVSELFPRLSERPKQLAKSLSGGEQQMLAIGRALMTNPRLLVLDEATEGLAPIIRQEIWAVINRLKKETGLAILVIDKSLDELESVCDTATIIERGVTVWSGDMKNLTPDLKASYVGI